MDDFAGLQSALPDALAANTVGSGRDHVVVAMASFSLERLAARPLRRPAAGDGAPLPQRLAAAQPDRRRLRVRLLAGPRTRGARLLPRPRPAGRRPPDERAAARRRRWRTRALDRSPRSCSTAPTCSTRSAASWRAARPSSSRGTSPSTRSPWPSSSACPINGTAPELRSAAFKSAGRKLFHRAGVPVPLGREDLHTVDDVAATAEWIRAARPGVGAVVVKHDDSGAGDGNAVVDLRDASGGHRDPHEVLAAISALPAWFLDDLATGGGVVEEMVTGDGLRSPSVQLDLLPGAGVRVLATHDQVLGGDNGQVYLGCRFPADPAYAADLARHGDAVGRAARRPRLRRAGGRRLHGRPHGRRGRGRSPPSRSTCARAARRTRSRPCAAWCPAATTPRRVPGSRTPTAAPVPTARATTSSTPRWPSAAPSRSSTRCAMPGCSSTSDRGTGVVLHMLGCLAVDGRFGATAIGRTPEHADELYAATLAAVVPRGAAAVDLAR